LCVCILSLSLSSLSLSLTHTHTHTHTHTLPFFCTWRWWWEVSESWLFVCTCDPMGRRQILESPVTYAVWHTHSVECVPKEQKWWYGHCIMYVSLKFSMNPMPNSTMMLLSLNNQKCPLETQIFQMHLKKYIHSGNIKCEWYYVPHSWEVK
jgi:hypothetical protein